ncbi:OTU deubiquitinase with linear linkage specificity a [Phycodurus eques]|uniref:OTU deubiquitinase with linear linkage specificity a n=1 Tax=Phycodurus eques TaxID=693459 RepID=UPI002ACE3642|nr:OTU deubiquitinase with linear linkage specificity a [Phycodurus eques]
MSWFKAASNGVDDVFEDNTDELDILSKEWAVNMKRRIRDGYVDGADAGEDAALEVGFKEGFQEGAAKTVAVGRLRGIVCAIGSWYQVEHRGQPFPASVTELLRRVSQHEDSIVTEIMKAMEKLPPPSVDDVLESMEGLRVAAPQGCPPEGCQRSDCCRGAEQMDTDSPQHSQTLHSACGDGSSSSSASARGTIFSELVQSCKDIVSELGLPVGLLEHINELENV